MSTGFNLLSNIIVSNNFYFVNTFLAFSQKKFLLQKKSRINFGIEFELLLRFIFFSLCGLIFIIGDCQKNFFVKGFYLRRGITSRRRDSTAQPLLQVQVQQKPLHQREGSRLRLRAFLFCTGLSSGKRVCALRRRVQSRKRSQPA